MTSDGTPAGHVSEAGRYADDRFRTIIEASPTGFVLSDASGRHLKVNTAFCTMFGYEPAELIGQCFTILVSKEQRADLLAGHHVMVSEDRQAQAQLSLRRKDGSPISVLCSMVTIDDDDGQRCTAAFVMDVTEREEAAAALQASETRLRAQ